MIKQTKNGNEYYSKRTASQPGFLSPKYIAIKLYNMCWSVAHITTYLKLPKKEVEKLLK